STVSSAPCMELPELVMASSTRQPARAIASIESDVRERRPLREAGGAIHTSRDLFQRSSAARTCNLRAAKRDWVAVPRLASGPILPGYPGAGSIGKERPYRDAASSRRRRRLLQAP